jgi:hypothetical protein
MNHAFAPAAPTFALVEIVADRDVDTRTRLLDAAYRASRNGTVFLLVGGGDRAAVDRILDPVVRRLGVDVYGVRYLAVEEEAAVDEVLGVASTIVAASPGLRERLESRGFRPISEEEAIRAWSVEPDDGRRTLIRVATE